MTIGKLHLVRVCFKYDFFMYKLYQNDWNEPIGFKMLFTERTSFSKDNIGCRGIARFYSPPPGGW